MKRLVRPLLLTAIFLAGAFIHGFLSVHFLGLSYIFSLVLGAVLWRFSRPNTGMSGVESAAGKKV